MLPTRVELVRTTFGYTVDSQNNSQVDESIKKTTVKTKDAFVFVPPSGNHVSGAVKFGFEATEEDELVYTEMDQLFDDKHVHIITKLMNTFKDYYNQKEPRKIKEINYVKNDILRFKNLRSFDEIATNLCNTALSAYGTELKKLPSQMCKVKNVGCVLSVEKDYFGLTRNGQMIKLEEKDIDFDVMVL